MPYIPKKIAKPTSQKMSLERLVCDTLHIDGENILVPIPTFAPIKGEGDVSNENVESNETVENVNTVDVVDNNDVDATKDTNEDGATKDAKLPALKQRVKYTAITFSDNGHTLELKPEYESTGGGRIRIKGKVDGAEVPVIIDLADAIDT